MNGFDTTDRWLADRHWPGQVAAAFLALSVVALPAMAQDVIEASMQIIGGDAETVPCQSDTAASNSLSSEQVDCADESAYEQQIEQMLESAASKGVPEPPDYPGSFSQAQAPTGAPPDTIASTPEVTTTVPTNAVAAPQMATP